MDLNNNEIQRSKFLSDKQIDSFQQSDARINIFEGPVRAGKSFIALLRWIEFCRSGPPGPLIICGRTDKTIKRNIIMPLQKLVGNAVRHSVGHGEVYMYNRLMFVVGANDDRASAKIQGSEFAGALIDELTLMPENFFKMLLSRLSIPGAKLFGSTNPDSPYHWLKTDYMNRHAELNCKIFSYSIDDNPSLDEEYKKQLKKEYQGLWYKRYIEGLWVVAEGAVYDFFDEKEHVIPYPPAPATKYFVGIDYGTQNPCVFLLFGYNSSAYPNLWLEKEYYYDARKTMRQKSDYEYVKDLQEFLHGIIPEAIYIDPSASSLKVEMRRNGFKNIRDAVNDVLPGIRFQGQMLSNGTYKICSCCTETIKEYANYVWDEKACLTGDEKPIKKFDHCLDATRYFLFSHFGSKIGASMSERDAIDMERKYSYNYKDV
jgi:PBSX family phage terminase large subunit